MAEGRAMQEQLPKGGSGAFRSTAPATGTSQAMLGSGNPLRDGKCGNFRNTVPLHFSMSQGWRVWVHIIMDVYMTTVRLSPTETQKATR